MEGRTEARSWNAAASINELSGLDLTGSRTQDEAV